MMSVMKWFNKGRQSPEVGVLNQTLVRRGPGKWDIPFATNRVPSLLYMLRATRKPTLSDRIRATSQ